MSSAIFSAQRVFCSSVLPEKHLISTCVNMRGAKVYTTLFPCNECTKALIQTGISEVIYHSDKYAETDSVRASKRMFDSAGVTYRKYQPINRLVTIPL